ncbi:ParB N-terminal domain-containing protein [Nocardia abscessus]|uniref:ParB/RepB/Spo0J family partition protein n=1 Tax=Nocardia abscessus TaxID=120957 RepID=UPI0018949331|nr:ParB N-terminal domain-containing protein [Nocardia abscessus]MBF6339394.1 ParB N-terminal domain-containing protein [Nocardia abscessus]
MSAEFKLVSGDVVPLASNAHYSVSIDELLPADSPRSNGEDRRHIARLAESETELPPILVHRSTMRVIDGMHRLRAAQWLGHERIAVVFFDGTQAEAFVRGVELNTTHGLPLTLSDRKAAAERIIETMPQLSDRAIATTTGLSARTVATLRKRSSAEVPQSNVRIGADGRRRPMDRAQRRRRVAELLAASPDMPLRALAAAAEVSISTAHAIRKRLRETGSPDCDGGADQPEGSALLLQQLTRDPAMRHSQQGRDLLRWLHTHSMQREVWTALVAAVPPHCIPAVAELASRNAKEWRALAGYIDSGSAD